MEILNGQIIIKTEEDLSEILNKTLVHVISGKARKVKAIKEKELIVLYENTKRISESHYEWYLDDRSLIFTNITACEAYLIEEERLEKIAEALWLFKKKNGRIWKSKLMESFENGTNKVPGLQRFRNNYSFSLLNKIKKESTVKDIMLLLT